MASRPTHRKKRTSRRKGASGKSVEKGSGARADAPPRADARPSPPAEAGSVRVVYEDRDVLVLERSPHASAQELRRVLDSFGGGADRSPGRPWPVGSLERGLTGLALLTRSAAARRALEREGAACVTYLASVDRESADAPRPVRRRAGRGEPCVVQSDGRGCLVKCQRARPHRDLVRWLARRGLRVRPASAPAERLLVHAERLELVHPRSGRTLVFESPAPDDLGLRSRGPEVPSRPEPAPSSRRAPASHSERISRGASSSRSERTSRRAPGSRGEPTDWNEVADWLDRLLESRGHDHYRDLILPGVLRLLEVEAGQRALDVASGQGILCRALAERGVASVGVESSPRLVEIARARSAECTPRPDFRVGDARVLDLRALGRFDRAACVMALTNIDPIEPVLAGCARLLDRRGLLVLVIPHPAFRIPQHSRWEWDRDEAGATHQSRRVDAYLSPLRVPIVANPGAVARGEPPIETQSFHRPIEHYVRALAGAGLGLDRLEEWASRRRSDSGPRAAEENRARREIPLFLALRARPLG